MDLREWMDENRLNATVVGEQLCVHPVTVRQWAARRQSPRKRHFPAIWELTDGAVRPSDLGRPQWDDWCAGEVERLQRGAA